MRRAALLAAVLLFSASLSADAQERRRRGRDTGDAFPGPVSSFLGGTVLVAQPQGEFKNYVNGAFGVSGHFLQRLDPHGIVAVRAELGYLLYGHATRRQPLGGGALGLITVDVTTSNNIVFGGLGLQFVAPTGLVRPYVSGTLGFSYFFTESSIEGVDNVSSFASTENFADGLFSTLWGGGLYVPLQLGPAPVSLDLGAQVHRNPDVQYLTKNSIEVVDQNTPPRITPVRSAADFVSFRLGVSVGLRWNRHRENNQNE